jgi:outer membrane receptor protein involved in Fe transport
MVVLGSAAPVPLAESPRSVVVLPLKDKTLAAETPLDFLRQDSSIFLEQRGAGGAQSDIVLRGGSFEQTLVLLNGFRINDSQTSHHNLDLPVPLEAMDSIQVLEGAGSTLHGVDALSGVVDFLTAAPAHASLLLRAAEGSFESNEESLLAGATRGRWSGRLTASRNFSTGFAPDRDYRNEDASSENWLGSHLGITDLLFATSDRSFGANQFYGPYNSWERTKGWFASMRQELGSRTVAATAVTPTNSSCCATTHPSTRTTTKTVPGRRPFDTQFQSPPHRCCSSVLRPTATASTATTSACMPAIAARVTSTSTCARQRSVGISPPAHARKSSPAAHRPHSLHNSLAVCASRIN